jgi:penicillin-binding protein 1A
MLRFLRIVACVAFIVVVLGAVGVGGFVGVTLAYFGRDLPDYQQLANYVPATGSKVHAADGALMIEFETEHRMPVTIGQVPKIVVEAFLAAEDRDFYNHNGVNPAAILRAAAADVLRLQRGERPMGASTITQQVVRHFLLNNQVSVARKIKEMILAYRIEHTLSKNRILEIYLNEIYLGAGAYGVAAAADTYFQKPLDQLTLAEAGFLAALPKAPNNYNPQRHAGIAKARRDWVLSGMAEVGWISQAQAKAAITEPLGINMRSEPPGLGDGYFAEEVRRELVSRFGEKAVYEGGLTVRTSYTPNNQHMAETAFRSGLVEYDLRHGWRGPIAHLPSAMAAQAALLTTPDLPAPDGWQLAAVTSVESGGAAIALKTGGAGRIPLSELSWARRTQTDQEVGGSVRRAADVLSPGDIVLVEPAGGNAVASTGSRSRHTATASPAYALRQLPDVSGGMVVMEPQTGRVLALVGGWSFRQSQFDRATQAMRQPGSSIKPFVYVTALENGFDPSSEVDDSPVSIPQGPGLPDWQPVNYEAGYVGPTTLEDALVHSRNLATVHVAKQIGMPAIAKTVQSFDIMDKMPLYYSMALGAGSTTLLRLTTAYAMIDNGGHWLLPSVIDLVQDRSGRVIYQKGVNGCAACFVAAGSRARDDNGLYRASGTADPAWLYVPNSAYADNPVLYKPAKPDPLITKDADTELISMMQGVVQHGTGSVVAAVGKPLAGKTGTTSDWVDAWFVGFSPDLVAGVFVGFDEPRTLGDGEVGGHVAAPIFRDFMMAALKDKPAKEFPAPAGMAATVANVANENDDATDDRAPQGMTRNRWQPQDMASVNGPPGYTDAAPPSEADDQARRGGMADVSPSGRGWYGNAQVPRYPYAAPMTRADAGPGFPAYPQAWAPQPDAGAAPAYPPPQMQGYPPFPRPSWGGRPSYGTGGLY